jgi:hypothetical protein
MENKMKVRNITIDTFQGKPNLKYCIIHEGEAMSLEQAVAKNICVVREIWFERKGEWSRTKLEVTTKTATLVVLKPTFSGYGLDLDEVVKNIRYTEENYEKVTAEEATLAFKYLEPLAFQAIENFNKQINSIL